MTECKLNTDRDFPTTHYVTIVVLIVVVSIVLWETVWKVLQFAKSELSFRLKFESDKIWDQRVPTKTFFFVFRPRMFEIVFFI